MFSFWRRCCGKLCFHSLACSLLRTDDGHHRVCLRLYQLSKISRETLEERLGYDIPPVPEISIAGIKSRSVSLCWLNAKDNGFAGATLSVLCNGIRRTFKWSHDALALTGGSSRRDQSGRGFCGNIPFRPSFFLHLKASIG